MNQSKGKRYMQQIKKEKSNSVHILLWFAFILYLLLLVKLIIFKYPLSDTLLGQNGWSSEAVIKHLHEGNFTPFHTIRLYLRHWNWLGRISVENLIYNILAFVPYGVLLPLIRRDNGFFFTFLTGTLLSAAIEYFQLVTLLGVFDVDDIILNSFGVLLGYILYRIFRKSEKHV